MQCKKKRLKIYTVQCSLHATKSDLSSYDLGNVSVFFVIRGKFLYYRHLYFVQNSIGSVAMVAKGVFRSTSVISFHLPVEVVVKEIEDV